MDDIVAVRLRDTSGVDHYVITWGRVHDSVDPAALEAVVRANASKFGIDPTEVRVCGTLREARDAPYFHECLAELTVSLTEARLSKEPYAKWRKKKRKRMSKGYELSYCGDPNAAWLHPIE